MVGFNNITRRDPQKFKTRRTRLRKLVRSFETRGECRIDITEEAKPSCKESFKGKILHGIHRDGTFTPCEPTGECIVQNNELGDRQGYFIVHENKSGDYNVDRKIFARRSQTEILSDDSIHIHVTNNRYGTPYSELNKRRAA